jgi:chemotaxis signal transduction protein
MMDSATVTTTQNAHHAVKGKIDLRGKVAMIGPQGKEDLTDPHEKVDSALTDRHQNTGGTENGGVVVAEEGEVVVAAVVSVVDSVQRTGKRAALKLVRVENLGEVDSTDLANANLNDEVAATERKCHCLTIF